MAGKSPLKNWGLPVISPVIREARATYLSPLPALQFTVLGETDAKTEEVPGTTALQTTTCRNDAAKCRSQLANTTESGRVGNAFFFFPNHHVVICPPKRNR